jgi:hypothetical protein
MVDEVDSIFSGPLLASRSWLSRKSGTAVPDAGGECR